MKLRLRLFFGKIDFGRFWNTKAVKGRKTGKKKADEGRDLFCYFDCANAHPKSPRIRFPEEINNLTNTYAFYIDSTDKSSRERG